LGGLSSTLPPFACLGNHCKFDHAGWLVKSPYTSAYTHKHSLLISKL